MKQTPLLLLLLAAPLAAQPYATAEFWVDPSSFGIISGATSVCPEGAVETWVDLAQGRAFGQDDGNDHRPCWVAECGSGWPCMDGHRQVIPIGEGDGSQLEIEWGQSFALTGDYSLVFLLRPEAGLSEYIVSNGTHGIRLAPDLTVWRDDTQYPWRQIGGALTDQAWQVLEVLCSGGTCSVYRDGTNITVFPAPAVGNLPFRYVGSKNKGYDSFTGRLKAVGAWDYVLSQGERDAVTAYLDGFRGGSPPPPPPPPPAIWQVDVTITDPQGGTVTCSWQVDEADQPQAGVCGSGSLIMDLEARQ